MRDSYLAQNPDRNTTALSDFAGLAALPVCFAVLSWYLRDHAGPFWQWNLLDPSYFYLLDSLNLLNGNPPGHIYHPGITVHTFGALLIKLRLLVVGGVVGDVLTDPEIYLRWLSNGYIALNAISLALVGVVARRVFGNLLPALVCQLAPFMSTIVVKHAFLPKPEAMLVAVTLALIALALAAFQDGLAPRSRDRLAICFGLLGGFVGATKLTAVPVMVLPLFVLRGWRPFMIYAAISALAFAVFFVPAHGKEMAFIEYLGRVATTTGPHGSGAKGMILADVYFSSIGQILKRPSLKVSLILSLLTLLICFIGRHRGARVALGEVWMLIGVNAAQLAQAMMVAKQPTAFYMIPSYMLAAISILLSVRLIWSMRPERWRVPFDPAIAGALAFAIFVAAQTAGVERLVNEMSHLRDEARQSDPEKFKVCARIYVYAASTPVYAMFLANYVTDKNFSRQLAQKFPANDFWINDWWEWEATRLEDWRGERNFTEVRAAYPCMYVRGARPGAVEKYLADQPGGTAGFDFSCKAGIEKIAVLGVDCQGHLL